MNASHWLILNPAAVLQEFEQGTPEWQAYRRTRRNASKAATMLGCDLHQSRSDFVRETALGIEREVSPELQALFDRGHAAEAAARPLGEEVIEQPIRPCVLSYDLDGLLLSASLDGITPDGSVVFEHKLSNATLAASLEQDIVPPEYAPQLEQGLLVSGASRALLMCSDGTRDSARWAWYESNPELRARIIAGWRQFEDDVKNYKHVEYIPAAVAAPVMALPALSIQVNGSISLIDNLALFGEKLTEFIGNVNREPDTDEDFANLEAAVKTLQTAQDALEAAESSALAQTASIDEMRRTVAMYAKLARDNRLMFKKLVDAKKESLRAKIVGEGVAALREHIDGLNKRLGKSYMPTVPADFSGAAKGKRTITSLRSAVSDELARAKIAASAIADGIQVNLNTLRELAKDHAFLFADAAAIVLKAPDDFTMLVRSRIADHAEAERKKEEATRERIRAEEAEKLAKQQEADRLTLVAAQQVVPNAPVSTTASVTPTTTAGPVVAAAPIPQPAAWGLPSRTAAVQSLPPRQRPSGAQLVEAVALHFKVSAATAADWLQNTDPAEYAGWPKSA